MGTVTNNLFEAASIGMSLTQNSQASSQSRMEAELSAHNLEAQARRKELEAQDALALGRLEQAETVVEGRGGLAEQKANFAASGVMVNSGSAAEAAADKAAWTEYERQKVEYGAAMESWGLKYDAALLRQDAQTARMTGSKSGNSSQLILNAGKQVVSMLGPK